MRDGPSSLDVSDLLFAGAFKVYCGISARRSATDLSEAQSKGRARGLKLTYLLGCTLRNFMLPFCTSGKDKGFVAEE